MIYAHFASQKFGFFLVFVHFLVSDAEIFKGRVEWWNGSFLCKLYSHNIHLTFSTFIFFLIFLCLFFFLEIFLMICFLEGRFVGHGKYEDIKIWLSGEVYSQIFHDFAFKALFFLFFV